MSISQNIKGNNISRNMAAVSLRSGLRIATMAVTTLVLLAKSSAAPTFGGTDKAMVCLLTLFINTKSIY